MIYKFLLMVARKIQKYVCKFQAQVCLLYRIRVSKILDPDPNYFPSDLHHFSLGSASRFPRIRITFPSDPHHFSLGSATLFSVQFVSPVCILSSFASLGRCKALQSSIGKLKLKTFDEHPPTLHTINRLNYVTAILPLFILVVVSYCTYIQNAGTKNNGKCGQRVKPMYELIDQNNEFCRLAIQHR